MAALKNKIYIDSDNNIEVEEIRDANGAYINDATIKMSLFAKTIKHLDTGGEAVSANTGGKTTLPCTGHGLAAGDYIRIQGTDNYDGEYEVDSAEEDTFVIAKSYIAETFTGNEEVYTEAIENGTGIEMPYGTSNVWEADKIYPKDSKVPGTDDKVYNCIKKHTSATINKPITGSKWDECWERIDGYYSGNLGDDLVGLVERAFYYLFVEIVKDTSKLVCRMEWQAVYYPNLGTSAFGS